MIGKVQTNAANCGPVLSLQGHGGGLATILVTTNPTAPPIGVSPK
ncbi:MAG: hypothetical protein WCP28_13220 [Actinomycetes bacterium]